MRRSNPWVHVAAWRVVARHQAGALAATVVDFATMIGCVHAGLAPVAGTAIGASAGAVTNFQLGRRWIFAKGTAGKIPVQAARYAAVSVASLGLNTLGEFVLSNLLHVQYVLARVVVAAVVGVGWNFPLHRSWVFAPPSKPS
jgi:putative flippase GtrA